uniref:DUF667 domain-containing protein n=1 Tax=Haemonchus contortus TaxID=6289 RepID=A0A7I4Y7F5_HAECO
MKPGRTSAGEDGRLHSVCLFDIVTPLSFNGKHSVAGTIADIKIVHKSLPKARCCPGMAQTSQTKPPHKFERTHLNCIFLLCGYALAKSMYVSVVGETQLYIETIESPSDYTVHQNVDWQQLRDLRHSSHAISMTLRFEIPRNWTIRIEIKTKPIDELKNSLRV